uniref:Uncharacterized protein n=1 Tax=Plectus sambesii TaxID=2011161 RepID=A0A914X2A3_9BILA
MAPPQGLAICTYTADLAEQSGDTEEVKRVKDTLEELEQRASELDRRRTQSITAISWINQRNRDKMKETFLGGQYVTQEEADDDPFTRKRNTMKMVAAVKEKAGTNVMTAENAVEEAGGSAMVTETSTVTVAYAPNSAPIAAAPPGSRGLPHLPMSTMVVPPPSSALADDLFSAHDFDVDIDLIVPGAAASSAGNSKGDSDSLNDNVGAAGESSGHRALSLSDWKKKRGLL